MADYQKMYAMLFNELTEAAEDLQELTERFLKLQQKCEEMYISSDEQPLE